ncbi:hypothetical protein [Yersinia pseudotuberculosis]|uniref:hypothetical protein n=1 Tax=Yersinia pseudotuberculosis TaxID=633 RepID=UPI002B29A182|nr:hypothetical protein YPSE1_36390 [Yersinia pseudotuberculosis]
MIGGTSNTMDLHGLSAVRSFAFLTADVMLNITNKNGDNHEYKVTSSHVNNDKLQGPKGILKATKNHSELNNETIASGEKKTIKFGQLHVREIPNREQASYIDYLSLNRNIYLDTRADRECRIPTQVLSPDQNVDSGTKKPFWISKYLCITTLY